MVNMCLLSPYPVFLCVIDMSMHIYATHIPEVDNVEADHASRFFNDDAEIMLDSKIFDSLCSDLNVKPCIDLFCD